jgi:hypothetical protein
MDLFDRYFQTLRLFLPKDQRDDIICELSEEIRSQVAEEEAEIGRPLGADEQAAILGRYGHPLVTAARYRRQRYLIGPIVFPYYWLVLKVIIGLVLAIHVVGALMLLASGTPFGQLDPVVERFVATTLKVFGWITVLSALADWWLTRSLVVEKGNPSPPFLTLHAVAAPKHALAAVPGARRQGPPYWSPPSARPSEGVSVSGFVVLVVLGAWWLLALKFPYLLFGPGSGDVSWGAAIDRLYPVLAVGQVTALAEYFVRLTRPHYARFIRLTQFASLLISWFVIYLVVTSGHQWVVWNGTTGVGSRATIIVEIAGRELSLINFVDYAVSVVFILAAAGSIVRAAGPLLHWFSRRGHAAAHA